MEALRQFVGGFRTNRVDSRDHFDDIRWNRLLAMFQMSYCTAFLIICPTYMMFQLIFWGIIEKIFPQKPSCFLDNKWQPDINCNSDKTNKFMFTNQDVIDAHLKEIAQWFFVNSIKAILLCVGAILLLLATNKSATRSRQLAYCQIAGTLNLVCMAHEYFKIIAFQFQTPTQWLCLYMCFLYRLFFHIKVKVFYDTVKENAPPPPGYK